MAKRVFRPRSSKKRKKRKEKGTMKKILLAFGAAMLMAVGLVNASGLPTYLVGPDVPGGVVTVSAGVNSVSVDAVLPEGYGVVGVYTVGGNSPSLSVNNRDTNSVSWVYSPAGAFSVPGVGTFNERALFNPPGLRDGLVTLTSATSWSFGSATNVVAVAIEGDPSGETTWVVAYVPPPTATEVTNFAVSVSSATNRVVIRKLIGGKLTPVSTNTTVTTTASYQIGIGSAWPGRAGQLGQVMETSWMPGIIVKAKSSPLVLCVEG
jgi:hypothetical protein